jgi:hypothetical protein
MGFFNWMLKNGPGSPGSTANAFIKLFKEFEIFDKEEYLENWEDILISIFQIRYLAYQKMGFPGGNLLNQIKIEQILTTSKGDFPLFIYLMMVLETSQFRDNVGNVFQPTVKIIYDTVSENVPQSILLSREEFQNKASQI